MNWSADMAELEAGLPPGRAERLATGAKLVDAPGPPPPPPEPPPPPPPPPPAERSWRPCTDMGNAERLRERHGNDLRYCHPWKKWLVWDGQRWRPDDTGEPMRRAMGTVRAIAEEGPERAGWAKQSEDKKRLSAMLEIGKSQPDIPVVPGALDADPWLLNCHNGTLDLRTATLRPHARGDYITKTTSVSFDEGAECPKWEELLWDVMGENQALCTFLQRAFGYALTGDSREQALFFFYGQGANGKSTILDTLQTLLGGYACSAAPDLLLSTNRSRHPTELTDLFKARLVVCQETDQNREWNEGLVKRLTGDDKIKARRMAEDFWEFEATHKLFFSANTQPKVKGRGHAFWRRIKVVPFNVIISEERKDPKLKHKLREELPGILRWAVEGCLAWQRHGLNTPPEVVLATAAYREQQDVLAGFLADRCELGAQCKVTRKALRQAYERWCKEVGELPMAAAEFHDRLAEHGITETKVRAPSPVRGWAGVQLLAEDEGPPSHWSGS